VKCKKKSRIYTISVLFYLLLILCFANFASPVLVDPTVNLNAGNFTLNTKTTLDFDSIELGDDYINFSFDGSTYYYCDFVSNMSSPENHLCFCSDNRGNATIYIYAPADWTVTNCVMQIQSGNGTVDQTYNLTTDLAQFNTSHRIVNSSYGYPINLTGDEMGFMDVNVTVNAYNSTLVYHGYRIEEDAFFAVPSPYNMTETYNSTTNTQLLNWTSANGSDYDVVVQNTGSYALCPGSGTVVQNSTSSEYSFTPVGDEYYTVFSYNSTVGCYSMGLDAVWGALGLNCFNESNPSQNLTFDLFITTENGSDTYVAYDCTNTFYIDVDDIPVGNKTVIQVDSDGYEVRYYYRDLEINNFYLINTYLPKSEGESGGDDVPDTPQLFAHTDSASVTNPLIDQTINMDHDPQDVIGVYKYTITSDTREYHETTKSVVDHTTYEIVTLGFTATEIVEVSVYNTSISYWVPISSDNYTANSTHVNVSADVLDDNTTIIKVGYYGEGNVYYEWILIPEDKYDVTGSTCIINYTGIDNDTALVKIDYYYYGLPPDAEYGVLYVLYVKDYYGDPVENAKMTFKKYINTTDSFEEVSSLYTDANGQVNLYLIPDQIYKVFIEKTYYITEISDFTPDPEDRARTFRLEEQEITTDRDVDVFYGIAWSIEPNSHYHHGNFTIYFNITSSNSALDWYKMIVYKYNTTSGAWDQLSSQTDTTASGGSLSYTIQNVNVSNMTGKYKVECWYKKDGFDPLEVTQTGSSIFYVEYGGLRTSPVWNFVPDWVFLLVVVIIMALVMAFILPVAGVGTGYVGIGILAFALILKPDLTTGAGVSGWTILFITALVYTIALYIWSRI